MTRLSGEILQQFQKRIGSSDRGVPDGLLSDRQVKRLRSGVVTD